jgi:radical SAM superfamily enzyme YgiQ (UPF0313 family)
MKFPLVAPHYFQRQEKIKTFLNPIRCGFSAADKLCLLIAMNYSHTLFRPPAEARSLILRMAQGCPWNQCTFCGMYKATVYRACSLPEIETEMDRAADAYPQTRRIFLADGDVMAFSFERLKHILEQLNARFPRLARINLYASGRSILQKKPGELQALRALKLNTLYMGLESGDEATLTKVNKQETAEEMIEAGQRAQCAGLKMSVMLLTGLGGTTRSREHAAATAAALNRMQPTLLSALRVIPVPGTALYQQVQQNNFQQLTERQAVEELKDLIEQLDLDGTVFRANHASNILPLEGRFPKDQARLLRELRELLASGTLDAHSPGLPPRAL